MRWLQGLDSVGEVVDTRKKTHFQDIDIDFLVNLKTPNGASYPRVSSWEVKTDNYPDINGTLSYEIISSFNRGTVGCALKTQAEFIAFYLPQSHRIAYWKNQKLKSFVASCAHKLELIRVLNYHPGSAEPQVTLCLKVPLAEALEAAGGRTVWLQTASQVIEPEPWALADFKVGEEIDY